ncbi:MAG: diguanylate cyclase [Polyangiaceae bacterium]
MYALPPVAVLPELPSLVPPIGAVSRAAPTRILIVEDERIVALDLRGTLEEFGYDVVGLAASGAEAIEKAVATLPDLILMDIRLDGHIDGIQAAAAIHARVDVAVVYLSANADTETVGRALETAPAGYLAKPYNYRSLRTTIEVALRSHDAQAEARREREHLAQQKRELEHKSGALTVLAERLHRDSTIDALTGLYNRRHFDVAFKRELNLAIRGGLDMGLMLLDLDHFKQINDTFGHVAGDTVLRELADFFHSRLRPYDVACRYGGEEMAIVVPNAAFSDVCALAERLRAGIEALEIVDGEGTRIGPITASFGVSGYPEHGRDAEQLLRAADAALYRAKGGGRNQVAAAAA